MLRAPRTREPDSVRGYSAGALRQNTLALILNVNPFRGASREIQLPNKKQAVLWHGWWQGPHAAQVEGASRLRNNGVRRQGPNACAPGTQSPCHRFFKHSKVRSGFPLRSTRPRPRTTRYYRPIVIRRFLIYIQ